MKPQQWQQYIRQLNEAGQFKHDAQANADRLLNQDFLFDSPYAMEPTQTTYHLDPITWQQTPNGDPEWLYMLKRQEYLLDLLQTYLLTGEAKYQAKMKALLFEWIAQNVTRPDTWRTIDTGIRLLNWTNVVLNLQSEGQLSDDEQRQIDQAVRRQVAYLADEYIEKYDISNWGVLITSGILVYAARFKDVIPEEQVIWAQKKFETELRLQVDDTGMQWEQSPLYLLEVWRSALAVQAAQMHTELPIAPVILDKNKLMQRAIIQYVKPNGQLVQQGDTDAIRIDDLLYTSSLITGDAIPKNTIFEPSLDFLLVALLQRPHEAWPPQTSTDLEQGDLIQSGNFFWRQRFNADSDYWHVFNGNLGSGHGHAALGHVDLTIQGQDVLVDPGRYTYVDGTERRFLKSAAAHNTLVIDDQDFSLPADSWKYQRVSVPQATQVVPFKVGKLVRMSYLDTSQSHHFSVVRNWLSLPDQHLYLAIDQVWAPGRHTLKRYWQIASELYVAAGAHVADLGDRFACYQTDDHMRQAQTLFSPRYNDLQHLTRLEGETAFQDYITVATVIAPKTAVQGIEVITPQQSGTAPDQPVAPRLAYGLRIALTDNADYLITLQPENTIVGRKLYWYDGTEAYGTLNLFQRVGRQTQAAYSLL